MINVRGIKYFIKLVISYPFKALMGQFLCRYSASLSTNSRGVSCVRDAARKFKTVSYFPTLPTFVSVHPFTHEWCMVGWSRNLAKASLVKSIFGIRAAPFDVPVVSIIFREVWFYGSTCKTLFASKTANFPFLD